MNAMGSLNMNSCNCVNCKDEAIVLMSAGYEWYCPHCGSLNTITSIPEADTIKCKICYTEYPLMGEDHAHE